MFTKSQLLAAAVVAASASSALALPVYNNAAVDARDIDREAFMEMKRRAIMEYLEDLEARADKPGPPYGGNGGWINPAKGKGRDGKARQTSEVLAIGKHKETEPGHHAVAPGNTAHVHDTFHQNNGPNHATVKYQNPQGDHVTTLHIAKDGTRLEGGQEPPKHRGGGSPPPNSPASSKSGSPRSGSPTGKRDLEELFALFGRADRNQGPPYGSDGGWVHPAPGKGRDGKARQTSEVLAVEKHKQTEPGHHAVTPGNTAHVHDTFHQNNGPNHATVKYKNPQGDHVTTLHLAKDGTRLQGGQEPPKHRGGGSPPPNSPASSKSGSPRSGSPTGKRDLEGLFELFGRADKNQGPPYGSDGGWIHPAPGKGRDGKARQTSEVLAVDKHKQTEPGHHAVAPGNTAHVHDTFHQNNGPNHATVKYKNPQGDHVTTLHIAKDGTRLQGGQELPKHRGGGSPPPNSPASSKSGSPRSGSPTGKRELVELIARELGLFDELD